MLAPSSRTSTMRCSSIPPKSLYPLAPQSLPLYYYPQKVLTKSQNNGECQQSFASPLHRSIRSWRSQHAALRITNALTSTCTPGSNSADTLCFGNTAIYSWCAAHRTLDCLLYCCSCTKLNSLCCIAWHGLTAWPVLPSVGCEGTHSSPT